MASEQICRPQELASILIVDDTPEHLLSLRAALEDLQQNVVSVRSGEDALQRLSTQEFAVILLDINMPEMDGFETATQIRKDPGRKHTPIIFMTDRSDDLSIERSCSLGAADCLRTPLDLDMLRTKVAVFVELFNKAAQTRCQVDEFLATLSHELRTPLNAILGWTRLMQMGPRDAVKVERALAVIERNAHAQARLIDELLDMSRIMRGTLEITSAPLSLRPLVMAAVDEQRQAAEAKKIVLTSSLDGDDQVLGDAERLHQAVSNVLSNAVRFTPRGGRVDVALRRVEGRLELCVHDSGEGISPELLPFVFERFRQADMTSRKAHGGLGIGLAVARHIVERHGGAVSAESSGHGQGSTFLIWLPALLDPLRADAVEAAFAPRAKGREVSLEGLRVLLVEDDADTRQVLNAILTESRLEVTAVSSVSEALEALDRMRPDMLVSDIGMPGEDGYELIRRIRRRAPEAGGDVPAVALTAYTGKDDRTRALAAGFQMHVAKPATPEELIAAVSQLAEEAGAAPRKVRSVL